MDYEVSEEIMLRQLRDSIESGLIPDRELGIFIKEGYGALVGCCPANCSSIEDALNYTCLDFNRKSAGRTTIKERLREFMDRDNFPVAPYFGYQQLVNEGYDLVIGPGCEVYGEHWDKAIYCRNYIEILNARNKR